MKFLASKLPGLICRKARCINAIQLAFRQVNRGAFTQKLLSKLFIQCTSKNAKLDVSKKLLDLSGDLYLHENQNLFETKGN